MIFLVSVLSILIMIMKATVLYSIVLSSRSSSCSSRFFSFSLRHRYLMVMMIIIMMILLMILMMMYLSIISPGPLSSPAASRSRATESRGRS